MSDVNDARILRHGIGQTSEDYFEVSFRSRGERRIVLFAVRDLTSATALRSIGIVTNASKSAFWAEAETAMQQMPPTLQIADCSGWFGGTFVWPDGVWTGDKVPVCLGPEYRDAERMRDWGNLQFWRDGFANPARRNSRVMLVIAHAFTGPVANFLNIEAPAIQLVGEAGVFKTSLVAGVAAMWGVGIKSWHGTSNGIEEVAMSRHATHLVLDDFRVDRKHPYVDLRANAIRLTDGRTKDRMGQRAKLFCTPVLSTSNRTNDEHARLAGLGNDADQAAIRGRLMDVPFLDGRTCLFEDLHGRRAALDLVEEMCNVAQDNPGRPADHFVAEMRAWIASDEEGLRLWLRERRTFYEAHAGERFESVPGYDLTRAHGRFATIYAAGMLAIELRTVRWSKAQLLDAITVCEAAHVAVCTEGGRGDIEGSPLTALRRHIEANWRALIDLRAGLLDRHGHDHGACPGYINEGRSGALELLFSYQQLEHVCGGRSAIRLLRSELRHEDIILEGEARPSVKRFIYRGRDPEARVNVMALRADAFGPFLPARSS